MASSEVVKNLDELVHDFALRTRLFREPLTRGRATMFVLQHRLNTRQRNSVLKLRVATNCPDWETRIAIIKACTQELIADHEFGDGRPHWLLLEDLGVRIGLDRERISNAQPLPSTRMAWLAWDSLMSNRHWLEGLIANTCAERINVPGYGEGQFRQLGWFGFERTRWSKLFSLNDQELIFFGVHEKADIEHSDLGWNAVARFAGELHMADQVIEACRANLIVWEHYLNGIAEAGDALVAA
ncbi:MAG TPA: iron-containing redox enzyme family protein [Candidatus Binataceae bacterium]|jgi:pyrroloquinoline quinone (PQQ) biosynthesis protein C|nr:iron-containing redox enzyme family protein [Candidatus Binataceae bacterium]